MANVMLLRRLPNVVTALRLVAVPTLAWLACARRHDAFAAVLLLALASDVIDGMLARTLGAESEIGARLDSAADTLLFAAAVAGLIVFHADAMRAHPAAFVLAPMAWVSENVAALLRYGRLSSFHTYLSRLAAVAMGVFATVLFLRGLHVWLLYVATTTLLVATTEECVLLWMLPEWTADVRGVWWVMRAPVTNAGSRGSQDTAGGPLRG